MMAWGVSFHMTCKNYSGWLSHSILCPSASIHPFVGPSACLSFTLFWGLTAFPQMSEWSFLSLPCHCPTTHNWGCSVSGLVIGQRNWQLRVGGGLLLLLDQLSRCMYGYQRVGETPHAINQRSMVSILNLIKQKKKTKFISTNTSNKTNRWYNYSQSVKDNFD